MAGRARGCIARSMKLAELNRLVGIPIAGGENNRGVHEYRWMLEQNVFDILQPDIMVADGVTGFREIANMAKAHNKTVIPHHGGGNLGTIAQLHAIASWPHSPWIEILHDPPVAAYTNGFAIMENAPLVDKEELYEPCRKVRDWVWRSIKTLIVLSDPQQAGATAYYFFTCRMSSMRK